MFILILTCTYIIKLSFCEEYKDLYIAINDNHFEIERLLYGDITNIKDMFLPPLDDQIDSNDKEEPYVEDKTQTLEFDYLKPIKESQDIIEFNEITKQLNNVTRRYRGWYHGWYDPEEPWQWYYWKKPSELYKRERIVRISLQFLIHTRYQIKKAILKKQAIRTDTRYKMGYLFNRLKRIKFEQQKLVNYANEQLKSSFKDLTSLLKFYEKMVRYDVDITDTIKFIKDLDQEPSKMHAIPEIPKFPQD